MPYDYKILVLCYSILGCTARLGDIVEEKNLSKIIYGNNITYYQKNGTEHYRHTSKEGDTIYLSGSVLKKGVIDKITPSLVCYKYFFPRKEKNCENFLKNGNSIFKFSKKDLYFIPMLIEKGGNHKILDRYKKIQISKLEIIEKEKNKIKSKKIHKKTSLRDFIFDVGKKVTYGANVVVGFEQGGVKGSVENIELIQKNIFKPLDRSLAIYDSMNNYKDCKYKKQKCNSDFEKYKNCTEIKCPNKNELRVYQLGNKKWGEVGTKTNRHWGSVGESAHHTCGC